MKILLTEQQLNSLKKDVGEISYIGNYDSGDAYHTLMYSNQQIQGKNSKPIKLKLQLPYRNKTYKINNAFITMLYQNTYDPILSCRFHINEWGINIDHILADKSIRGQEIGIKVYQQLGLSLDLPVCSGTQQNSYSRYGIWEKLMIKYPDKINVINTQTKEVIPFSTIDKNKIYSDLEHILQIKF
jgi:hypothetical protein